MLVAINANKIVLCKQYAKTLRNPKFSSSFLLIQTGIVTVHEICRLQITFRSKYSSRLANSESAVCCLRSTNAIPSVVIMINSVNIVKGNVSADLTQSFLGGWSC